MPASPNVRRVSRTRKLLVATATLIAVGGLGAVGVTNAGAATQQCGAACVAIFSRAFGTMDSPNFVETARDGLLKAGDPTELEPASGSNPAEDFVSHGAMVSDFFASGMVSA